MPNHHVRSLVILLPDERLEDTDLHVITVMDDYETTSHHTGFPWNANTDVNALATIIRKMVLDVLARTPRPSQ